MLCVNYPEPAWFTNIEAIDLKPVRAWQSASAALHKSGASFPWASTPVSRVLIWPGISNSGGTCSQVHVETLDHSRAFFTSGFEP
jgi:hypothetical protein